MKVSVIIPFYNTEKEICECLGSVFAQTYPHIEVILVNDGSTDNSKAVVEEFITEYRSRYEIIIKDHEYNRGASAARNTGINVATGDYLYFLDSDDRLTPTSIESLVRPLERKRYDMVIGDYQQIGYRPQKWKLKIRGGEWNDTVAIVRNHCHQNIYVFPFNKLCNRAFLLNNSLYFEEGVTHEDVLWSLRVCLNIQSMYVVKEVTYHYYVRDTSVSGTESWQDELRAYIRLLPLMNDSFVNSRNKCDNEVKYDFFDDIFLRRYKWCYVDHMKEEYVAMRALDPRPASWILKKSISSISYLRANIHRLLPVNPFYSIITKRIDRVYQQYRKDNRRRSRYYDKINDRLKLPQ